MAELQPRDELALLDSGRGSSGCASLLGAVDAPAVAVPLFDRRGHLLGALSIVVPIERASEEAMQRHAELLKDAAAEISLKLG